MIVKSGPLMAFAAILVIAAPAVAQIGATTISLSLSGAAEGPGLGDPDGSGRAELRIDPDQGQVCYSVVVEAIDPAFGAHIHRSPVGVAGGPIVVVLDPPTDGDSEGCTSVTAELAREILGSPAEYYLNIHTPNFPDGAVRAQLG